jgi:hypothetical protein
MEVGPHQDSRCLECRMTDLEQWLTALSAMVGWSLVALTTYLIYRHGGWRRMFDG